MTEWYCYKDKVKMVDCEVSLRYLQLVQKVPGLSAPIAGTAYLTKKVVRTVVKAAEELLERKK